MRSKITCEGHCNYTKIVRRRSNYNIICINSEVANLGDIARNIAGVGLGTFINILYFTILWSILQQPEEKSMADFQKNKRWLDVNDTNLGIN